jgi:GNAT superfamily N-acetyltransferase
MLPREWSSPTLRHRDVRLGDLDLVMTMLAESQDLKALDPSFGSAPAEEIQALIERSLQAGRDCPEGGRPFQMQLVFRGRDCVGYWHLTCVPNLGGVVGVSILLIRPAFRRSGVGTEWVQAALAHLRGHVREFWARVYLANPRALAFWTSQGLTQVAPFKGAHVHGADSAQPSIILSRQL